MKQNKQHFKVSGRKKHINRWDFKHGNIKNEPQASGDVRNINSFLEQIKFKIQL